MTAAELLVVHELANGVRERYITYKPTVFPSFSAFHTYDHFKLSLQSSISKWNIMKRLNPNKMVSDEA
jgi:hypothetical protein